jgi:hypothetical protein
VAARRTKLNSEIKDLPPELVRWIRVLFACRATSH